MTGCGDIIKDNILESVKVGGFSVNCSKSGRFQCKLQHAGNHWVIIWQEKNQMILVRLLAVPSTVFMAHCIQGLYP